jgi:tetratricopeptide (TPR) repeat protein
MRVPDGGDTSGMKEWAMRDDSRFPQRLMAALVALVLGPAAACADEIPISVLQDWQYLNNTGWMYLNKGAYAKAEERFKLAIEAIRPYQSSDQRLLARSYADLARVLYHERRYADAEPLARWALSVRESHPKTNPDALFQSLYTLALIHLEQAHFPEAERLLRRALELQEKVLGPTHLQTALTLDELAGVCVPQRKYAEAEQLYRRAIKIQERINPDENPDLAGIAEHYATLLKRLDRIPESEKWQARAKAIRDAVADRAARARLDQPVPGFRGF